MNNFWKKLTQSKTERFTASKVFSLTKYGRDSVTKEELYNDWFKTIKDGIYRKTMVGDYYSYISDISEDKEVFLDRIKKDLEERGFQVYIIAESTLKDFKGPFKYLLITWDKAELEEGTV